MGLQTLREVKGRQIALPNDMWGVIDRIQNGDATCGWTGDPSLFVMYNQENHHYEIWQHCNDGLDRICFSFPHNEFDARVLMKLSEGDLRYRDPFADVDKHNESLRKDQEREAQAMEDEIRDVLKFYRNKNE